MQVNHRNQVRHDNRLANLELVTPAENAAHRLATAYYSRVRPQDEAAVDPAWLARVRELAATGAATREQVVALMADTAGKSTEPEPYRPRIYGPRPENRFTGRRRTR